MFLAMAKVFSSKLMFAQESSDAVVRCDALRETFCDWTLSNIENDRCFPTDCVFLLVSVDFLKTGNSFQIINSIQHIVL